MPQRFAWPRQLVGFLFAILNIGLTSGNTVIQQWAAKLTFVVGEATATAGTVHYLLFCEIDAL